MGIYKFAAVGLADFASVPAAYFSASLYGYKLAAIVIAVKGGVSVTCQLALIRSLKAIAHSKPQCFEIELRAFKRWSLPYVSARSLCVCFLQAWVVTAMTELPEAIDTAMDAAVAGNAKRAIPAELEIAFAASWDGKAFGLGDKIAALGLARALLDVMLVSTAVQLLVFLIFLGLLRCNSFTRSRLGMRDFWSLAVVVAEASSLKLVEKFAELCTAEFGYGVGPTSADDAARGTAAIAKALLKGLFENYPTAWLQASLAGILAGGSHMDRLSVIFTVVSISTSLYTMIGPIPVLAKVFYGWVVTLPHAFRVRGVCIVVSEFLFLFASCAYVFAVAATVVHVFGIGACPHHNFEITSLSCASWNFTNPATV